MVEALRTELIREPAALRALEAEWSSLLRQNGAHNIFLSWDWLSAWWRAICPQPDLYVITVRDTANRLLGIAPFHRHPLRLFRAVTLRCLRVLASERLTGAEYPDLLIRHGSENEVIEAIAKFLREHSSDWDCAWIPNVGGWQSAPKHFAALAAAGNFLTRRGPRIFSAIPLPADSEAYERSLSKNARHHLRRCTKKLMSTPGAELVVCDDKQKLDAMLETHIRLNQQRWKGEGKGGTFRFPQRIEFYRHVANAALASGTLGFFGLRTEGELRALWFGFIGGEIYYSLSLSYDVEFEERTRTGPANVLFGQMLPLLLQRGVREFDHLGGVSEYKTRWGAQPRDGCDILICANSLKGRLLHHSGVWPSGRSVVMETPGEPRYDTPD
jgi:CelD/BcsL family acetyltransferase involved in cellulose biosynthesis